MLLTIHNLPSNTRYVDIKVLLRTCGLTDVILDNLESEGNFKKVTVGLADEGDAAILVRKVNGLFVGGNQLYVEDVRPKKGAEQPYRPKPFENPGQQQSSYTNQLSYPSLQSYNNQSNYLNQSSSYGQMENTDYMANQYLGYTDYQQEQFLTGRSEYPVQNQQGPSGSNQHQWTDNNIRPQNARSEKPISRWDSDAQNNGVSNTSGQPNREIPANSQWAARPFYEMNKTYESNYSNQSNSNIQSHGFQRDEQIFYRRTSKDRDTMTSDTNAYDRRSNVENRDRHPNREDRDRERQPTRRDRSRNRAMSPRNRRRRREPTPPRSNRRANDRFDDSRRGNDRYQSGSSQNRPNRFEPDRNPKRRFDDQKADASGSSYSNIYGSHVFERSRDQPRTRTDAAASMPPAKRQRPNFTSGPSRFSQQDKKIGKQTKKTPNPKNPTSAVARLDNWGTLPRNTEALKKIIAKDQTWRGQATSHLVKEVLANSSSLLETADPEMDVQQHLKRVIRARLSILLDDKLMVPLNDMVLIYRSKFKPEFDHKLFSCVVDNIKKMMQEGEGEDLREEAQDYIAENLVNIKDEQTQDQKNLLEGLQPKPNIQPASTKEPIQETVSTKTKKPQVLIKPLADKQKRMQSKAELKAQFLENQIQCSDPVIDKVLDEEMEIIKKMFLETIETPPAIQTEENKKFCDAILRDNVVDKITQVLKVTLIKRIENVAPFPLIRVFGTPKLPNKTYLMDFLRSYGVVNLRKSDNAPMFIATVDSYESFDRLCAMAEYFTGETTLSFKPLHVMGPPPKVTRAEIVKNKAQFINRQIIHSKENLLAPGTSTDTVPNESSVNTQENPTNDQSGQVVPSETASGVQIKKEKSQVTPVSPNIPKVQIKTEALHTVMKQETVDNSGNAQGKVKDANGNKALTSLKTGVVKNDETSKDNSISKNASASKDGKRAAGVEDMANVVNTDIEGLVSAINEVKSDIDQLNEDAMNDQPTDDLDEDGDQYDDIDIDDVDNIDMDEDDLEDY